MSVPGWSVEALAKSTLPELFERLLAKPAGLMPHLLEVAQPLAASRGTWAAELHFEIPTQSIVADFVGRPGDVDVIVVPWVGGERIVEESCAIEVKLYRATYERPGKSPSSHGTEQVKGLASLGFRRCALLHIALVENAPAALRVQVPELSPYEHPKVAAKSPRRVMNLDLTPIAVTYRSEGRMAHLDIPDFIGVKSLNISFDDDATQIGVGLDACRIALANPSWSPLVDNYVEASLVRQRGYHCGYHNGLFESSWRESFVKR